MNITDKQLIKKRFNRNSGSYNNQAIVQKQIASKLSDLLSKTGKLHYGRILEIGCGTGFLTQNVLRNYTVGEYIMNDLVDSSVNDVQQITSGLDFSNYQFISGDAEKTTFPKNLDAIVSASSFQWFNNLEFFISRMNDLLNRDGIIAFSTFGKDNFQEIRSILNVGLKYKSIDELSCFIDFNFNIIHAEEWRQQVKFPNPFAVLKHMKLTGVNGLNNNFFGKYKLQLFNKRYTQLFSNKDDSVNLTYHPIIIIARKKQLKTTIAIDKKNKHIDRL